MKNILFVCVVASLFIACSKRDIQKWLNKHDNPKPPISCKIDSIYPVDKGDIMQDTWHAVGIHYNDQGNPEVLNYSLQALNPYPKQFSVYYTYDNKNRLIEVIPPEVDAAHMEALALITPHKFVYEGNSLLPVRDSILSDTFFGVSDGVAYKVYTVKVEDLYYDSQDRINKIVSRRQFHNTLYDQVDNFTYEIKYSYDSDGNRQEMSREPGAESPIISYTDKPSLFSLHPVWQLVHRNWSKNAVAENVQQYNSKGLPTRADINSTRFLNARNTNIDNPFVNIDYTCD